MEIIYILLFSLSIFFFFFFFKSFRHHSHTKKLPPGPTGLPVLGSLLQLGSHPNQSLAELSKIHGSLMTLRLGFVTNIIVSSPEAAKEILLKHDQNFSDRSVPDVITSQPNPEATLAWVPADHGWRNRRKICKTEMFTTQRLDSLQHLRHQKVRKLIEHIKKHSLSGRSVNIGEVAFGTTLNMMSSTMFSIDIVDSEFESAQEFKDLVWTIMEDSGKQNLSDYFPLIKRFDLQGLKRHIRPAYLRLHEIFDEIIDKRLEDRACSEMRKGDFLDVLLDQCHKDGSEFNRKTIKPLILDLFIAGSDTSTITTEWAMAELLRKPEILTKAQTEIEELIGSKRDHVNETDIDRLPYLQAVVKETMRLHPPVPLLLPYKAKTDVEVYGFFIPKDTQVMVNAWAIGRDPRYWDDAPSFNPERFLGSNVRDYNGRDFMYIPFGAGRRICPGLPLASRMVHLMLASIIHAFDWKLEEGTPLEKLDMEEQFGVTLKKAVPLCIIPILRN